MSLSPRIAIPIGGAILLVAAVIGLLFWQLEGTRALLSQQLTMAIGSGSLSDLLPSLTPTADGGDEVLLHLRKGDLNALRGEWKLAADEYKEAADAGGGGAALRKLAQAQLQQRDVKGAEDTLDQMRRINASPEDVLLLESIILLRTAEISKVRQLLESAPESPHKHYGLALLNIVTGNHEAAKPELAATASGWDPILRAYARTLAEAYEEYALFPNSPALHLQTLLGRALAQVQECELALPILAQVTHEQNDYRDAWIVQGFCELTSGRTTEALSSLEHAYQLDPEKPEIQFFLARAYIAKDDHGNALTFLQYALRNGFSPESEVRRLIAQEALEIGNAVLALEQYEALTNSPEADIDAYTTYVSGALTAGHKEEAFIKAQEAATKWTTDARAFDLLGWAAIETNRMEEARAALNKALELDPELESAKERMKKI
jgi:tetratricopeptide (TPR) repeat protein